MGIFTKQMDMITTLTEAIIFFASNRKSSANPYYFFIVNKTLKKGEKNLILLHVYGKKMTSAYSKN